MGTVITYPHIVKVEGKPARLERLRRIRVAQIAIDYINHGWSADDICFHYPHLRQAEVHSALAYYFDHQAEIDAEIADEERLIEEWRKSSPPTPFALRLERLWKAIGGTEPGHALRKEVELFASEGKRKEQIQAMLHWLLQRVRCREGFRQAEEDAILDVLDGLAVWCHADASLLRREKNNCWTNGGGKCDNDDGGSHDGRR